MAKRKPLVFVAGEIVESSTQDTLDLNNATVIAAGSTEERILKDRFADIVNVKDFGAVGNGATDDTAAFRAAVSAALARGAVVYVPDGTYKLDDPIEGEFISFGHPVFVGEGSISYLTDLYNDYVHKTNNINETVTGNKTFSGTTTIASGNIHTKKISGTTVTSTNGTCDLTLGNVFEINATSSNKNIDLTNAPVGNSIIGLVINKGENKVVSWPDNIEWAYGIEPELITGYNYIYLMTPNAGIKWYGASLTQPIDLTNFLENPSPVPSGLDEEAIKAIVISMLLNTGGLAVDSNGKLYVKLKNPGGLAEDVNGLYINLTTNGGLQFDSNNKLKVKINDLVKTGGGILVDSNGKLYIDLSNLNIDPSILDFDLSNYVDLDSAQTITGVKTFSNGIIGDLDGTADQALADGEGNNIIATYAPLVSPELTGTPTAPTPTTGDNSTKLATTAFVQTAIENSGNSLFSENINNLFFSYINSADITYGLVYSVSEGASSDIYGFKFSTNLLNNIKQQPFPLFILNLVIGMQNSSYTRTFTEFSVRENNLIQSLPLYMYDATNRDWVRYTNVSHNVSSSSASETIYGWAYYDFNGTINSHAPSSILFVQNTPLFINYVLSTILSPNISIGGRVDTEHIQVPIIQTDSFGKIDSINGTTISATKNNATNAVYFTTGN